jgi:HAMP domain-containing protein
MRKAVAEDAPQPEVDARAQAFARMMDEIETLNQ